MVFCVPFIWVATLLRFVDKQLTEPKDEGRSSAAAPAVTKKSAARRRAPQSYDPKLRSCCGPFSEPFPGEEVTDSSAARQTPRKQASRRKTMSSLMLDLYAVTSVTDFEDEDRHCNLWNTNLPQSGNPTSRPCKRGSLADVETDNESQAMVRRSRIVCGHPEPELARASHTRRASTRAKQFSDTALTSTQRSLGSRPASGDCSKISSGTRFLARSLTDSVLLGNVLPPISRRKLHTVPEPSGKGIVGLHRKAEPKV